MCVCVKALVCVSQSGVGGGIGLVSPRHAAQQPGVRHARTRTHMHAYIHTHIRGTCKDTYMHAHIHTRMHRHTRTHVNAYIHTYMRIYIHTHLLTSVVLGPHNATTINADIVAALEQQLTRGADVVGNPGCL